LSSFVFQTTQLSFSRRVSSELSLSSSPIVSQRKTVLESCVPHQHSSPLEAEGKKTGASTAGRPCTLSSCHSRLRVRRRCLVGEKSFRPEHRGRGFSPAGALNYWGDRILVTGSYRTISHTLTTVSYPTYKWFFCHPIYGPRLVILEGHHRIFSTVDSWVFQGRERVFFFSGNNTLWCRTCRKGTDVCD
jgi:hypothetical protein